MKYHHIFEETLCVNGVCIKATFIERPPYIKLKIKSKNLTNAQKDLIYRLFLEERFLEKKSSYRYYNLGASIENVLLKRYTNLCNTSINRNYSTVISYLLSHSLVENNIALKKDILITPPSREEDRTEHFKNFYASLIDVNVITKMPNIFDVTDFAYFIKFPNEFINDNFDKYFFDGMVFYGVDVQKPSFEVLAEHIDELNIDCIKSFSYLTKEQINELTLLSNMVEE